MVIVIGDNQWTCTLASTYTEIKTGLSGVESLPAGQGMLFDVGYDRSRIDINMSEMLFPLDIVFINSNLTVVGVLHNVQPGDEAYFLASNTLGARYFMEVNAGEAASVNVGDAVTVTNDTNGLVSFDMNTMLQYMVFAVVLAMVARMTIKALGPAEKKPLLLAEKTSSGSKGNPGPTRSQRFYWRTTDPKLGEVYIKSTPFKSPGKAIEDALKTWSKETRMPYPSTEAGQKALLIEVFDEPPSPDTESAKRVAAVKVTAEAGAMPVDSSFSSNPGLIQPSRTYFTPESKTKLDRIMKELPIFRQSKVDRLFEVMEGVNHKRRAIQEQRSLIEPLSPLELELRDSFMHNYITYDDYNRYISEVVAIENRMDLKQWGDALSRLNKLMFSVADVFLVDFPEKTKREIMDIVKAIWRMR